MNLNFRQLIFFFFLSFSFPLFGQVTTSAEIDSTNMLIGDQMALHLMVNHPEGTIVLNPEMNVLEESKIEILNVTGWDTLQKGVEYVLKKDILFTAWDSGYVFIPKIPIPYQSGNQTGVAATNEIPLMVGVPQIDTTLAPIKDIIREPQTFEDFIPMIAVIVGLLLAVGLFFYFKNRKSEEVKKPKPEIILPPHEIALNKLTSLKNEKLWQKGEVKAYQSKLTYIVREYLENRFEVPALENTTDEILRSLKNTDLSQDWEGKLREMLQMADLVKFAKAQPQADFHDKMMNYAEDFVYKTKKIEISKEEETENDNA
jgi:hypothetical protein